MASGETLRTFLEISFYNVTVNHRVQRTERVYGTAITQ
jgi:hypothetical protein